MPTVTIDGRTVEVETGTNLVDAAMEVGVQIPHYCYHPRLSIVGQCRMCLVKVEGMPKLQAGCSTQVMKDGMVVLTQDEEVQDAQRAMMEFLLINHPLDCPICDQAGECGLQDYAFKHGVAFSRFRFEDKRIYPGRERIPLGPNVVLNMNRCIQCTRCVRFTQEVSKTGELGFFQRGARTEIGVFPGKELDGDLAANVVDICPVGALTSAKFRFAERVWYLDKKPSICPGCDVGCNITLEHRRGDIKRYKPRFNPAVNDYWMCDYGRRSHEAYRRQPRLTTPRVRQGDALAPATWETALDLVHQQLRTRAGDGSIVFFSSGNLTTEESYLLARLADAVESRERHLWAGRSKPFHIPNLRGGVTGHDDTPNRRGAELAGYLPEGADTLAREVLEGDAAEAATMLFVADSAFGPGADDPETVARLRRARFLVVLGWADTALAQAADVALPLVTPAETDGTFVNVERRLQRFRAAFPSPGDARRGVEVLADLAGRFDTACRGLDAAGAFAAYAAAVPALAGVTFDGVPPHGISLAEVEAAPEEPVEAPVV